VAKIGVKNNKKLEEIGEAVLDAWDAAIIANPTNPSIDRKALELKLTGILDLSDMGDTGKTIEVDTDLTTTKRLVWLAIPTPDPDSGDNWKGYKKKFYDDLTKADKRDKKRQIAEAILFGCGR